MARRKKKSLSGDMLDLTVGTVIAAPALQIVGESDLPPALRTGTQSMIGVGLLKGASKLGK